MAKKVNDHDLLLRIDERQKNILGKVSSLCEQLDKKVDYDADYQEIVRKVENLWDSKNRMIGWMLGAGIAGGTVSTVLKSIVEVLAK